MDYYAGKIADIVLHHENKGYWTGNRSVRFEFPEEAMPFNYKTDGTWRVDIVFDERVLSIERMHIVLLPANSFNYWLEDNINYFKLTTYRKRKLYKFMKKWLSTN